MSSLSYFLAYNSLESREFHQNSLKPTKYLQYFLNANFVTINGTSYHWTENHAYYSTMLFGVFIYGYVLLKYEKHAIILRLKSFILVYYQQLISKRIKLRITMVSYILLP